MASYTTRPNRPQGPEYCLVLPGCVSFRGPGVETLGDLLRRYNKNRLDWEGRNLPSRQWQAVTLAVSAPGALVGDLFLPDGAWVPSTRASIDYYQSVWQNSGGVSIWASVHNPNGGVLFRRVRGPATTPALPGGPPPANSSDSDSDWNTDDEEEAEEGNTVGM